MKFYICEHCGNIITKVVDKGVPVMCCGQKMTEIAPKTAEGEAGREKHLPVVTVDGNNVLVKVGDVPHPMTDEHSIQWVILETDKGHLYKDVVGTPEASFVLADEKVVAVYSYCNLHGLWKTVLA